ncbi:GNAT family N-acetyltransferase [Sphingomonas sp. GlSt437]|uniref:GNAT family N-acetyltransferase n=1 Tax=Sphingomonas sp. GlSt437 TaxID=3389970 RepID=UPI003A8AE528
MADAPPLVLATRDHRDAVAAMLARAFADDPAMSFIFPDPQVRARKLPALFQLLFDADAAHGVRLITAGGEAATLWRAPGHAATGIGEMLRHAFPMLATFGTALGRALAVSNAISAHMPAGGYWYLHIAGCDPAHQGKGLGGAAIGGGLDRVARGRLPAYLETATESNLGLYQHYGFRVLGDWRVPGGGPHFWSMWRDP